MDKLKVAFLGLDHVHTTQMYHYMKTAEEKITFVGMADFLSEDKTVVAEKVRRTAQNRCRTKCRSLRITGSF